MGELGRKMKMDMELKSLSLRTIQTYLSWMKKYTLHYGRSPEKLGDEDIRDYLYFLLKEKKVAQASINQAYSALKFFYQTTLGRSWQGEKIPRSKVPKKLPVVLAKEEVQDVFLNTGNLKHLGAEIGFIAVLHTWTQTLLDHPHVHCIVPGGGLSPDRGRWISSKKDFFIPVKVLSRKFRGKFLHYLKKAYNNGELVFPGTIKTLETRPVFEAFLSALYAQEWVVYCKPPFKKSEDVIDYMGRYTHRVAISNDRIVDIHSGQVTFKYRDRANKGAINYMTLDAFEFIRRFLLHVLPDGFMKVRHYGLLSNRNRKKKLVLCKASLGVQIQEDDSGEKERWEDLLLRLTGIDPRICPTCGKGRLVPKEKIRPKTIRSPP